MVLITMLGMLRKMWDVVACHCKREHVTLSHGTVPCAKGVRSHWKETGECSEHNNLLLLPPKHMQYVFASQLSLLDFEHPALIQAHLPDHAKTLQINTPCRVSGMPRLKKAHNNMPSRRWN